MVIDEKADVHFKEKLSRALKQRPIQMGQDVLTVIKSVFGENTELSLYIMNDEVMKKLGINIHRHITISGNIGFS